MKTGAILLLSFLFCFHAKAQDVITVTKTTARTYTGTIGQKKVRLNLSIANKAVRGEFVYQGIETPMELKGMVEENRLSLTANPAPNYTGDDIKDTYFSKGAFSATLDGNDNLTGSFHPEGNSNSYEVHLNKIFELSYIDSSLRTAYINHNPDYKLDTVYTLSLDEISFIDLSYRTKLRNIKYWYSYPMVSIMARNNYQDLNSVGNVKLEEMGFQDGDYLLKQNKGFRHASFPYRYRNGYSVAYADQHFLSMCSDVYIYNGASHPFTDISYKSYDLLTGDSLKLDSLFLRGGKYYLDSVGEICFRKQNGLGPSADLATAGYYWNDSMFHVSSNFYFTISGICFVYNTYEIASYNMGVIKFIIPYDMLKPIIRRRGSLGWVRNE